MFFLVNESPRRAVNGHTVEQKEQRKRKEKQTRILENMQRGSQETLDRGMAMVVGLYGKEHTYVVF